GLARRALDDHAVQADAPIAGDAVQPRFVAVQVTACVARLGAASEPPWVLLRHDCNGGAIFLPRARSRADARRGRAREWRGPTGASAADNPQWRTGTPCTTREIRHVLRGASLRYGALTELADRAP